jgi:uncharacterized protein (TIGR01244 family)
MEITMKRLFLFFVITTLSLTTTADHEKVYGKASEGIRNLRVIDSKVACAGAITPETVPSIKNMGFVSIINLRRAEEDGARIAEESTAAKSAGLNYVHIPFNSRAPETSAVDQFLAAFSNPGMEPAFVHCAGGTRAAAMWYAKLVMVDNMDKDHAFAEAKELGLGSEPLKDFMDSYIDSHR